MLYYVFVKCTVHVRPNILLHVVTQVQYSQSRPTLRRITATVQQKWKTCRQIDLNCNIHDYLFSDYATMRCQHRFLAKSYSVTILHFLDRKLVITFKLKPTSLVLTTVHLC